MTFEVELLAFPDDSGTVAIRPVDVPDAEISAALEVKGADTQAVLLDLVFHYGQNDHQRRPFYSVSVGDVIRLGEGRFRVERVGFERVA